MEDGQDEHRPVIVEDLVEDPIVTDAVTEEGVAGALNRLDQLPLGTRLLTNGGERPLHTPAVRRGQPLKAAGCLAR